jgi:hypothetical protein
MFKHANTDCNYCPISCLNHIEIIIRYLPVVQISLSAFERMTPEKHLMTSIFVDVIDLGPVSD